MQLVMQLVNNYPGGLPGLLQAFTQSGLGQQAQSWVSTGQNLPISPDQIAAALGGGQLQSLARQLGMNQDQAAGGLADLLPQVVDHLTPNGAVQDDVVEQGLSLLRSKLMGVEASSRSSRDKRAVRTQFWASMRSCDAVCEEREREDVGGCYSSASRSPRARMRRAPVRDGDGREQWHENQAVARPAPPTPT